MLEGSVMEYVKWFIMITSVFFISVVVIIMFQMNAINSFQQEVNYQIERHGGLTNEALADLDRHAEESFGGCVRELPSNGITPTERTEECPSPFFLKEFVVEDDGTQRWFTRGETRATFGTQIHYALTRNVGTVEGTPIVNPSVIGTSVSRIRGD